MNPSSAFTRSHSTPLQDPGGVGTAPAPAGSAASAAASYSSAAAVAAGFHPPNEALLLALRRSRPDTRLFRVLFQYIPLRDSPNENPQLELPLQAGDYILVHGEMDEDRFYHGETLYGQTGLVPSNYVERVSDEQLVANAAAAASRSHSPSFPLQVPAHHAQIVHDFSLHSGPATAETPLPDSVCPYPPVDVTNVKVQEIKEPNQPRLPYPRELTIEKKMSRSVVLSWSPPEDQLRPVSQYHVCVDNSVKAVVPGTYKCKALIEDVFLDKFVNLSVRAMSEQGSSVDAQCTMAVGAEAPVAPQHVRVWSITPVGACVGWYPSNSNAEHILLLNAIKVGVCPPSVFQVQLQGLLPSTIYRVSIRTKHPKAVLEQRPVERCVDFKTLPKIGLPEPPKNVQVEAGPQPGTLLVSWTPVSSQPLPPSRAAVHSYLVFADGRNIAQVPSANADHVLLRLSDFADDPPLFITVRVRTREGTVSPDSNVIRVPRSIANLASNIATSLNSSTTQMNNLVSSMVNNQQQLQSLSLATNPIDLGVGAGVPGRHSGGLLTTMSAPSATLTRLGNTVTIGGSGTLPLRKGSAGGTLVPSYENQMLMNGGVVGSIKDLTQVGTWRQSPSAQLATQPTSSAIAAAANPQQQQYYTFHPKLLAKEFGALDDKPSVLEMENNYVLKHRQQWPSSISDATRHRLENYVRSNGRSFSAEDPMNRAGAMMIPPPPQMMVHRQQFKPLMPPRLSRVRSEEMLGTRSEPDLRPMTTVDDDQCRLFVALFDYAPHFMSPNPNALQDELPLRKHQVVRVYGDVDADGFYHGYNGKRFGLVPSNMVIEIAKSDLMPRRRRSDANFPSTAAEPALRRMRWGSLKSRSYDHAGDRRPGPRDLGPLPARYPGDYDYYSSLDRRDHSLPPQAEPYHPREPPRNYYDRGDDGYESGYNRPPPSSARYGPPRHYHSFTSTRDRDYLRAYQETRPPRDPRDAYDSRGEYPTVGRRGEYGRGAVPEYLSRAPPPDDYRSGGEYGGARDYGTARRSRGGPPAVGPDERYRAEYRDEREMMDPTGREPPRRYAPETPYQDDRRGPPPPPGQQRPPPMDYRREDDSGPSDYDRGPPPQAGPPGPPAMKGPPGQMPVQQPQPLQYQDQQHTGLADDRYAKQNGGDRVVRQMVAKFSYSSYLSPNVDADQMELQFREGDIITIFGEIDEDGFFYGELNGIRGLVPSNFLTPLEPPRGGMLYQQPPGQQQPSMQQPPQQQMSMSMTMPGPQAGMPQVQPPLDQAAPRQRGVAFTDTASTAAAPKRVMPARQASQTSNKVGTGMTPTGAAATKPKTGTGTSAGTKPATKKVDAGTKSTTNNRKSSQAIKKTDSQLKKKT